MTKPTSSTVPQGLRNHAGEHVLIHLHSSLFSHFAEAIHFPDLSALDSVVSFTQQRLDILFGDRKGELKGRHLSSPNAPLYPGGKWFLHGPNWQTLMVLRKSSPLGVSVAMSLPPSSWKAASCTLSITPLLLSLQANNLSKELISMQGQLFQHI